MTRLQTLAAMTAFAAGVAAHAQSPVTPRPTEHQFDRASIEADPRFAFFGLPVIVDELKLTDAQRERRARIADEVLARHKDAVAKLEAENKAVVETLAADAAAREHDAKKRLDDVLTKYLTDDQKKRARQIALQTAGLAAFRDPAVAEALKLTDEQKRIANERPDLSTASRLAEDLAKIRDKLMISFSADQKAKWEELRGPAFDAGRTRPTITASRQTFDSTTLSFWVNANSLVTTATSPFWKELGVAGEKASGLRQDLRLIQRTTVAAPRPMPPRTLEESTLSFKIRHESVVATEAILTDTQKARLAQIRKQLNGPNAYSDLAFLKALAWTPAQNAAVERATAAVDKAALARHGDPNRTGPAVRRFRDGVPPFVEFRTAVFAAFTPVQRAVADAEFGPLLTLAQLNAVVTADRGEALRFQAADLAWSPAGAWERQGRKAQFGQFFADARDAFREALRLNPAHHDATVGLVTLLAACPEKAIRDGEAALDLALKRADADGRTSPDVLDALAMAYAEAGHFDDAVACQKQAIARLKEKGDADAAKAGLFVPLTETRNVEKYELRLKGYEAKTPYRFKIPNPTGIPGKSLRK